MPFRVDCHRADGPVLHLRIEAALRQQLVELAPPFSGDEPVVLHLLQPRLATQPVGAFVGQEDVRPALHQHPGKADGGARGTDTGDCAGAAVRPVHDRRVELDQAFRVERASSSGVETGIVLEDADRRLDRIDRASAAAEDVASRIESIAKALPGTRPVVRIAMDRAHRTRAAMNHKLPGDSHGGVPSHRRVPNPRR